MQVLKNLNLTFAAGKVHALVGGSGSGKSTIASLLLRFYEVNEGSITIGGVNIQSLELESLRSNISYVPQDPILFSRTILENIAYGEEEVGLEKLQECLTLANAEFVNDFPDKELTQVGMKGRALSGGQKQRVMIARALNNQPSVIILDEATSALDAATEKEFLESFVAAFPNCTRIIITHTIAAMKMADIVIMLESVCCLLHILVI